MLVIPTYRRANDQRTYGYLPRRWKDQVVFLVDQEDRDKLGRRYGASLINTMLYTEANSIAAKRAYLLQHCTDDKLVMLDDDLEFTVRTEAAGDKPKTRMAKEEEIGSFLDALFLKLHFYAHAGFCSRQGQNTQPRGWREVGRMQFVLGYRPEALRQNCFLGRIDYREDMDYTLQLLRAGLPNAICGDIGAGHKRYDAPGGCSGQRSVEDSNAAAEQLAALHPGLVRVAQRDFTMSTPRLEVTCYWKKAFNPC